MESVAPRVEAVQWSPLCIEQLRLQGLACLAACGKQLERDCSDLLKTYATEALIGALEAAGAATAAAASDVDSTAEQNAVNSAINGLSWLLKQVPKDQHAELLVVASEHVVLYPAVAQWQAHQFCRLGVRIHHTQLIAAANSMVLGVEVWAQTQQEFEIRSDISPAAVAICCNNTNHWYLADQGLQGLQDILKTAAPKDLPGLLQLSMNCKRYSRHSGAPTAVAVQPALRSSRHSGAPTAVAARASIPEVLEPAAARRLLVTAAVRHGANTATSLAAKDSIRQHIDAATFESVITHLLAAKECYCTDAASKADWWELPAASELDRSAVARLLQAVVNQPAYLVGCGCAPIVQQLCSLPAAAVLSCTSLESLLLDAADCGTCECVAPLFGLAAAKEVRTSVIVKLLFAAAQRGGCHKLGKALLRLPGVALLCSDTVVQLLRSAVQQKDAADAAADVEYLKGLPAARHVSSSDITHIVTLTRQRGHAACAALLQGVPHV